MSEKPLRWLSNDNEARFEEHTPENSTPDCKPNCYGHYVWPATLVDLTTYRIITMLEDPALGGK